MNSTTKIVSVFATMIASIFMINIEVTAMYVILQPIGHSVHMSFNQLPWVITSYLLLFGSVMAIGGKLGDLYGHRTILVIGLILFGVASLAGGMTNDVSILLLSRAVQGLSAAFIFPMATTIAFDVIPAQHKGLGMGVVGSAIGFGLAIGPLLGGMLTHLLTWRWVFFMNIPLVVIALLLTLKYVDKSSPLKSTQVDMIGGVILVLLVGSLVIGFNQLIPHAMLHRYALYFLVAGGLLAVIFYYYEKQVAAPIIPKILLQNKSYLTGCMLRVLTAMPLYILLLVLGLYSQKNLHLNSVHSSLMFLPMTISIGILSPLAGKLIDRWGAQLAMLLASSSYIVTFALLATFMSHLHAMSIALLLIIPGVAFSLASPGAMSISLKAATGEAKGSATAVFYMTSVFSGLIGVAFSSGVMAYFQVGSMISVHALFIIMWAAGLSSLVALVISLRLARGRLNIPIGAH